MSLARKRWRRHQEGFTLVEVLVALTLLAVVAAAVVPILVVGQRASTMVRYDTLGKNLTQERLEQLRQLPFQVDRQNGPFIDLLDNYYPSLVAAGSTDTSGWVSATGARTADEPSTGAFYRTVSAVTGQPGYTQRIALQFLRSDRLPVPPAQFALYDSGSTTAVIGRDAPPSSLLGVTVTTAWVVNGRERDFKVFSQIGDQGSTGGLLTTQARAAVVKIESRAADEQTLTLNVASVSADGRLADGSTTSVRADAGQITRAGTTTARGAAEDAAEPGAIRSGTASVGAVTSSGSLTDCDYAALGRSAVTGTTPSVLGGLPKLPSTVGVTQVPASKATAALFANSGGSCGILHFDNDSRGGYDPDHALRPDRALVDVPDVSGSAAVLEGTAWLNASPETAASPFAAAGASATTTTQRVQLLHPDFVTDGNGLIGVRLLSSSLTCSSSSLVTGPALAYQVVVDAWVATGVGTGARTQLASYTWSSTTAPPALALATVVHRRTNGTVLTLGDYFSDLRLATALSPGATKFTANLDSVFDATVKPVVPARPTSGLSVRVGSLSCVANDFR